MTTNFVPSMTTDSVTSTIADTATSTIKDVRTSTTLTESPQSEVLATPTLTVREPHIDEEPIYSLAEVLSKEHVVMDDVSSCTAANLENCASEYDHHSVVHTEKPPSQATTIQGSSNDSGSPLVSFAKELKSSGAPLDKQSIPPATSIKLERQTTSTWPKIWRYEAEILLCIAIIGCDCVRHHCDYLENVNDCRKNFVAAATHAIDGRDLEEYTLLSCASQLIDAVNSLQSQHVWADLAHWLRSIADYDMVSLRKSREELFRFECKESLELQRHFREDAGDDETTTRMIVWDFLHVAKDEWAHELDYAVQRLEDMISYLPNPLSSLENDPKPSDKHSAEASQTFEAAERGQVDEVRQRYGDDGPQREKIQFSGYSNIVCESGPHHYADSHGEVDCTKVMRTAVRSTRHYQLPTRSSLAKVKEKVLCSGLVHES